MVKLSYTIADFLNFLSDVVDKFVDVSENNGGLEAQHQYICCPCWCFESLAWNQNPIRFPELINLKEKVNAPRWSTLPFEAVLITVWQIGSNLDDTSPSIILKTLKRYGTKNTQHHDSTETFCILCCLITHPQFHMKWKVTLVQCIRPFVLLTFNQSFCFHWTSSVGKYQPNNNVM